MNLYEFATQAGKIDFKTSYIDSLALEIFSNSLYWTEPNCTSTEQFEMLQGGHKLAENLCYLKDENEFRMLCLFVYWSTVL